MMINLETDNFLTLYYRQAQMESADFSGDQKENLQNYAECYFCF